MATIKLYKKAKRQPCYRLSYRDPITGKWRQRLLHNSRDEAEEIRKKYDAEFGWLQTHPHLIKEASELSLSQTIEAFFDSKKHEVSSSTIERYRFGLKYVEAAIGSETPFANIKKADVDRVISFCSEMLSDSTKSLTTSSINTVLRHFRALLNWAHEREFIDHVIPMKQLKIQKKPIKWLSQGDVSDLLKNCSNSLGDIIRLYILTGARRNELLFCTWKDIDLKKGRILLPNVKSKQKEYLYLNKQAKSILKKYKAVEPRPFPMTISQLRNEYAKACTKAKLTSTIHDLRRTCGARLVEKGVDIFRVSKFLRHSSVKVTQDHYVELLPSDYPEVAENIEI
jgi:integrase